MVWWSLLSSLEASFAIPDLGLMDSLLHVLFHGRRPGQRILHVHLHTILERPIVRLSV